MSKGSRKEKELLTALGTIKANKADETLAFFKAGISALPIPCSGVIAEILTNFIPNQRIERVTNFLYLLSEKVEQHELILMERNKFSVDVLEDSVVQASKALSEDRNSYLASITINSIDCDVVKHNFLKLILYTLAELTDYELEVLQNIQGSNFESAMDKIRPKYVTQGFANSLSEHELNEYQNSKAAFQCITQKFVRLNLITEFSSTHHLTNENYTDISSLQRALIEYTERNKYYELSDFGRALVKTIVNDR